MIGGDSYKRPLRYESGDSGEVVNELVALLKLYCLAQQKQ